MNAQQLRNSILQEAIEGRLVSQDPNDEPASVLLERIREEKKRLVKEGKLKKKDLEEMPISEEEKPFEIPDSWEWCKLGAITTVLGGKRIPAGRKLSKKKTNHIYIRVSDMKEGTVSLDNLQYVPDDIYPSISRYIIKKEDVFITVAGTIGRIGKIPPELDGANLTENADRLVFNSINQDWLIKCLQSSIVQTQITDVTTKVGQPKLAIIRIQNLLIPLPPLAEQKRIVAKIEELLPKVEEYGKAQEALDKLNEELPEKLKKSVLQEAITGKLVPQDPNEEPASVLLNRIREEKKRLVKEGKLKKKDLEEKPVSEDEKPFEIPDSWEWVRLLTLCKAIHYGYTASAAPTGNSKLLRITDIQEDKVSWPSVPFCSIKEKDLETYHLHNRDILIARTGGTVGKTYIVRELNEIAVFASYLIRAIPLDNTFEEYIKLFMGSPYYWRQLTDAATGTGQPNVNGQSLSKLILPLPPLAEQKRIVAKIEEVFKEIDKLKA